MWVAPSSEGLQKEKGLINYEPECLKRSMLDRKMNYIYKEININVKNQEIFYFLRLQNLQIPVNLELNGYEFYGKSDCCFIRGVTVKTGHFSFCFLTVNHVVSFVTSDRSKLVYLGVSYYTAPSPGLRYLLLWVVLFLKTLLQQASLTLLWTTFIHFRNYTCEEIYTFRVSSVYLCCTFTAYFSFASSWQKLPHVIW